MIPQSHPVIKALRTVCSGHLSLYEAVIAEMQTSFFLDRKLKSNQLDEASVRQFLLELFEERPVIYTKQETIRILKKHHPEWVKKLFKS